MSLKKVIGQRIRKLREGSGFSQEELGERLDISSAALSKIEKGTSFPSAETFEKFPSALGISLSELFDKKPLQYNSISTLQHLVSTFTDAEAVYFMACVKEYMKLKRNQK